MLLCCLVVAVLAVAAVPASPLSVPGDDPDPATLSVTSFERVETGCADDVATYASSSHGRGTHSRVSFVETGSEAANLSAWTERTSPAGAALTTFRVHVESIGGGTENASCSMGTLYRLELAHDRGSSDGLLSGDEGTRVLWLENGEYVGCSASTEGTLDSECHRFLSADRPDRTRANATAADRTGRE